MTSNLYQSTASPPGAWRESYWWVIALGCWLLGAVVFFRDQWLSQFDLVSGPTGDGRLILYNHEHLYQWLLSHVSLRSPQFFFPQPYALAYTDALLLDLIPYAALRFAGLDLFLSHQFTLIALTLLGYACFIGCLRIAFAVRYPIAIVAALLFAFGNPTYLLHIHTNFFAIHYAPAIALIALWALGGLPRLSPRLLGGVAASAILFALYFATDFYPAWFTAVGAIFAALCAAVCLRRQIVPFARAHARVLAVTAATAALAFGVGLVPFFWIYGPVMLAFARTFNEYLQFSPYPQFILNLSPTNFFWRAFIPWVPESMTWLFPQLRYYPTITPTILFSMLAGAWLVWRGRLIDRARDGQAAIFVMSVAFAFIAMWLLTFHVNGKSLFWLARILIPGATAIRAGARFELWMLAWVVAALAVVLDRMLTFYQNKSSVAGRRAAIVMSAYLAFCLFEQGNEIPPFHLSRRAELSTLAAVPPPPGECKSFFLSLPAPAPPFNDLQTLMMLVSQKIDLPTLNGNSAWNPPGWELFVEYATYQDHVRAWIAAKGLNGVCSLAMPHGPWMRFQ